EDRPIRGWMGAAGVDDVIYDGEVAIRVLGLKINPGRFWGSEIVGHVDGGDHRGFSPIASFQILLTQKSGTSCKKKNGCH
ncbi:MAG: hypothetical protein ACE5LX_01555, partial [Nitrospinota bacterium]